MQDEVQASPIAEVPPTVAAPVVDAAAHVQSTAEAEAEVKKAERVAQAEAARSKAAFEHARHHLEKGATRRAAFAAQATRYLADVKALGIPRDHPLLALPEEWADAAGDPISLDEVRRALATIHGSLSEAVIEERRDR